MQNKVCCRDNCDRLATHGVEVSLWAKGRPKKSHDPLKFYFDLGFCLPHAIEECAGAPRMVSHAEAQERINRALAAVNRAAPDFTTAEAVPISRIVAEKSFDTARRDPNTFQG